MFLRIETVTAGPTLIASVSLSPSLQANVAAGDKFSIEHESRVFEVVAPEGCESGQTINIIVAKVRYDDLQSILEAGTAAAENAAKEINERYSVVDRATKAFEDAKAKATELDAKYKMSESALAGKALDVVNAAVDKAKALNDKYQIQAKVKELSDRLVVYAIEIDEKYAVRSVAARLVVDGVNAVVSSSFVTPKTLTAQVAPEAETVASE